MFIDDNMIVDIKMDSKLEAKLIESFLSDNYRVLFSIDRPYGCEKLNNKSLNKIYQ